MIDKSVDVILESILGFLIRTDKNITKKFTDVHYLILTTDEGFECGRTNNEEFFKNLIELAKKNKKNIVEVGVIYYFIFGQTHGLGYV